MVTSWGTVCLLSYKDVYNNVFIYMLCIIVIAIPNLQCNVFDPHASEPIIAIAVYVCACNEKLVPWARLGICNKLYSS